MQSIVHRGEFIKNIAERRQIKKYLEIGIEHDPKAPYRLLSIDKKISVDIDPSTGADFIMTSDNFFNSLNEGRLQNLEKNYKWDIIFIDADHNAQSVYRDLINSIEHLDDDGIIFMHDVLPIGYERTLEKPVRMNNLVIPIMNSDAWKVFQCILKERADLHACTVVDSLAGLGLVMKCKDKNRKLLEKNANMFLQYSEIERDMRYFMNTINPEEVFNWINNPTYGF
jgi:hypothetical protein